MAGGKKFKRANERRWMGWDGMGKILCFAGTVGLSGGRGRRRRRDWASFWQCSGVSIRSSESGPARVPVLCCDMPQNRTEPNYNFDRWVYSRQGLLRSNGFMLGIMDSWIHGCLQAYSTRIADADRLTASLWLHTLLPFRSLGSNAFCGS